MNRWYRACSYLLLVIPFFECLEAECPDEYQPPPRPHDLRVIGYNIGNGIREGPYALRLMDQSYEDHLGAKIRAESPHIVALQEALPPTTCATFVESNPGLTCYDWANRPSQAERLLGDAYSIVCDANLHVECVGVHRDLAPFEDWKPVGFPLMELLPSPFPWIPVFTSKASVATPNPFATRNRPFHR